MILPTPEIHQSCITHIIIGTFPSHKSCLVIKFVMVELSEFQPRNTLSRKLLSRRLQKDVLLNKQNKIMFTALTNQLFGILRYGEVEEMNVCDNLGDHLVGNVYIKFRTEENAAKAVAELNNRWFGGRPIYAELSPVTDFREACCRKLDF